MYKTDLKNLKRKRSLAPGFSPGYKGKTTHSPKAIFNHNFTMARRDFLFPNQRPTFGWLIAFVLSPASGLLSYHSKPRAEDRC